MILYNISVISSLFRNFMQNLKAFDLNLMKTFFFSGKVEMISGVGNVVSPMKPQWNKPLRPIRSSGIFGKYMITSASNTLFVIDGKQRTISCEIGGVPHPTLMIWINSNIHHMKQSSNNVNN